MAISEVVEQNPPVVSGKNGRPPRLPGAAWSSPAQLWRSLPMIRLLTEISAVPQVGKIEILVDGAGIQVHIVVAKGAREAASTIFAAERDYLNATKLHSFDLHINEAGTVPAHILDGYRLAGFETVLER